MSTLALPPMQLLRIRDFSGGLNLRDAEAELGANESPDMLNVTLDERGGASKRLGYSKVNPTAFSGGLVSNLHYSDVLGANITQAGPKLYLGTTNTDRVTFSTAARVGICDFDGAVWAIHPVDGIYNTTNGTSWSAVSDSPVGTSLAAWQNRLLACGDPANGSRVYGSAIGDGTDFTTSADHGWTNDLRETKDGQTLLCFEAASGVDISGRPGIVVCKRDSTYRIYDSDTGAYQTLDPDTGAASTISAVTSGSKTLILSRTGVYMTDGISPLTKVSSKIDPLFQPGAIAETHLDLCAAGALNDRCYFSIPRNGQTANDLALEFHTTEGWFATGSNAASAYTTFAADTQQLYAGSPTVSGRIYLMFDGGDDDGADIASHFQTRWFEPNDGILTRLRRATPLCRGSFDIYTRSDFETGQGIHDEVVAMPGGFLWGTDAWGSGTWGPSAYQRYADPIPSLGTCKAVSFRVEETSSLTLTAPPLLGTGTAATVGAWGLSGVDLLHVQLGLS